MSIPQAPQAFQTTRWSLVRLAIAGDEAESGPALAALCEAYWYPLYAYFRRSGQSPEHAEDLTQGFFARLLSRDLLASADPDKGRLRSFLLTCAQNYLRDAHDRAQAQKRAATLISFNAMQAEERYAAEPTDTLSPDRLFQRRWALSVLDQSMHALAAEYAGNGQTILYDALRPFLGFGPDSEKRYDEISASLRIPIGTLKNKVFRLRERWRQLLFDQVAATLDDPTPEDIKGELAELLDCV
ncbi:sigma factor [soil metagenome]